MRIGRLSEVQVIQAMWAYELWETRTGNLMAAFDSETEALDAARERARRHGPESVATVALMRVDDEDEGGEMIVLASGVSLLERQADASVSSPTSPALHVARRGAT